MRLKFRDMPWSIQPVADDSKRYSAINPGGNVSGIKSRFHKSSSPLRGSAEQVASIGNTIKKVSETNEREREMHQ